MNFNSLFSGTLPLPVIEAFIEAQKDKDSVEDLKQTRLWQACQEAGIKDDDKPLTVFSFDTDKIKEYVFASPKLPEIRGGSKLIKKLDWKLKRDNSGSEIKEILGQFDLPDEAVVYASGGGGILIVPAKQAEDVAKEIKYRFSKATLGATVTCAWLKVHPMDLIYGYRCLEFGLDDAKKIIEKNGAETLSEKWKNKKCFGELITILSENLQRKKGEPENIPFFEAIPYAERCDSCGMRPAKEKAYDDKKICEVCLKKMRIGREGEDRAEDMRAIGDASEGRAKGYVGVIYADGNGMGAVLQELKAISDYRNWSRFVHKTFQNTIDDIQKELDICGNVFEKLVTGGDDIILLMPGDKSLLFSEKLAKKITEKLRQYNDNEISDDLRGKMGLGVGVLIAHYNFPALYMVEYAEQLMKNAKKCGKPESAIDFAILTDSSPVSTSITDLREELYSREHDDAEEVWFTKRPYIFDEFVEFIRTARQLKTNVPQSQIYFMRELIANQDRRVAEINFLFQVARSKHDKGWKKWISEVTGEKKKSISADIRKLIWEEQPDKNGNKQIITSFIDYTEVYHFIDKESVRYEKTA